MEAIATSVVGGLILLALGWLRLDMKSELSGVRADMKSLTTEVHDMHLELARWAGALDEHLRNHQ